MDELEQRVIACVAELLDQDAGDVGLETSLALTDADSLDWAGLVLALESEFGEGSLAGASPDHTRTVGAVMELICRNRGDDGGMGVASRLKTPPRSPGGAVRRKEGE